MMIAFWPQFWSTAAATLAAIWSYAPICTGTPHHITAQPQLITPRHSQERHDTCAGAACCSDSGPCPSFKHCTPRQVQLIEKVMLSQNTDLVTPYTPSLSLSLSLPPPLAAYNTLSLTHTLTWLSPS